MDDLDAVPYIDFPSNATASRHGSGAWQEAYWLHDSAPEAFGDAYHDRSNVESTIGAIKQRVGERIDSRNALAQKNEVLCKLVAYNVTVFNRWWHTKQES